MNTEPPPSYEDQYRPAEVHSRAGRECLCVKQTLAALSPVWLPAPNAAYKAYGELLTKLSLHVAKNPSCNLRTQTQPHHLLTSGQLQAGHPASSQWLTETPNWEGQCLRNTSQLCGCPRAAQKGPWPQFAEALIPLSMGPSCMSMCGLQASNLLHAGQGRKPAQAEAEHYAEVSSQAPGHGMQSAGMQISIGMA